MQFGVCGDTNLAAVAAQASYEYAEWSVPALLKPRETEDAFRTSLASLRAAKLPYPVANGFIPGDLKITGPDVDQSALRTYITTSMARAEQAGIQVIVFGSGGARRIPDGFSEADARDQLVAFCQMVAPLAHAHGVTVVVEPLNNKECNVLNTVGECAQLVNDVDHPAIRLLVDAYHLMSENDPYEEIVKHGDLLAHVHIATVPNRRPPGAEACDFTRFFAALADANYTGRVSIEAKIHNPDRELPKALQVMQQMALIKTDGDSSDEKSRSVN